MGKAPTAGILLAAGMSERLGRCKQLLRIGDGILVERGLAAALNSRLDFTVLVLGHEAERIRESLPSNLACDRLRIVVNPAYRSGMASSLAAGVEAIKDQALSAMVLLADMPLISAKTIDLLLARFLESNAELCAPLYQGRQGHPAIFGKPFFPQLLSSRGDIGGREILRSSRKEILFVQIDDPSVVFDIDTAEDLAACRRIIVPLGDREKNPRL